MVVKRIYLQVAADVTVLQLMQKIHQKKGIPVHEMQMRYNDLELTENATLASYGITNNTSITLKTFKSTGDCPCENCKRMERKVTINVISIRNPIEVECKLGDPVETLKNAIQRKAGIAVAKQKLTFKDRDMEDHKLLASFNFEDEEGGAAERPVVHLLVGGGDPGLFDKLRSMVSRSAPAPAPAPEPAP